MYQPQEFVSNAEKLLLVNQHLRAETLKTLERLRSITYDLDIIMVDDVALVATWTNVPVLTTNVEQLNVTLRMTGKYNYKKREGRGISWREIPQDSKQSPRIHLHDIPT
jgi:hypothetical protein